jgi:hypothetical protein
MIKSVEKLFELEYEIKKIRVNDEIKNRFNSLIKLAEKINFEPQTIFFKINWKLLMMVN